MVNREGLFLYSRLQTKKNLAERLAADRLQYGIVKLGHYGSVF